MVDTPDSKSGVERRAGSSPAPGTTLSGHAPKLAPQTGWVAGHYTAITFFPYFAKRAPLVTNLRGSTSAWASRIRSNGSE